MRTVEKLDLVAWGFGAFVVMAAVIAAWAVFGHQPLFESRAPAPAATAAPGDGGR